MSRVVFAIAVALLLILPAQAFAEGENYCKDEEANQKWMDTVEEYPKDYALQAIHAIRLGLCEKIERGEITLEQGTLWFQDLFQTMKQDRFREKLNEQMNKQNL